MQRIFVKAAENLVPLNVSFELTYRCNERCPHCYCEMPNGKEELSTDEVRRALEKIKEIGSLFLTLTGGEILLRSDFFEIASYARELGFVLRLKTNGLLLDEQIAKEIARLQPEAVHFSLYGADAHTHDRFTGVIGSFDRLMSATRYLRKLGVPVLLAAVFTQHNFRQCARMYKLAESLDAALRGSPSISHTQSGSAEPLDLAIREFEDLKALLAEKLRCAPPPASALAHLNGDASAERAGADCSLCSSGITRLRIDPYGDVHPCILLTQPLGNILKDNMKALWRNHPYLNYLRSLKRSDCEVCSACKFVALCRHCPADSLYEHGRLTAPSSVACRIARAWKEVLGDDPIGKVMSLSAVESTAAQVACPD